MENPSSASEKPQNSYRQPTPRLIGDIIFQPICQSPMSTAPRVRVGSYTVAPSRPESTHSSLGSRRPRQKKGSWNTLIYFFIIIVNY